MSKKKAPKQRKPNKLKLKGHHRLKALVIAGLILCFGLTSVILAQWRATRRAGRATAVLSPAPLPQPSPSPTLSKEYIYAGGKLIATEEPAITSTPTPTISPTPTPTPTPQSGGYHSLSLNGSTAYATVPNSSTIDITGAITIEAWIKPTSINDNYQEILCRDNWGQVGTGGGYELSITNTGKVRFDLYQSNNTYTTVIGNTMVTAAAWHHVAAVFDGSQMRIYLDGALDGNLSTTNGPASGTSFIEIGNTTYANASYYFGGLIDEVRLSASALYSSNFIPSTHLTSTNGVTKGLWKFDGQVGNDSSGNANNSTLYAGATYSTVVPEASEHSLSLNGTDASVQVPVSGSSSLDIAGAITLEAWVKYSPNGAYQDIITRETWGQAGTGGGEELTINPTGKLRLDFYQSHYQYTTVIGTTISAGAWHHVAGVYDGSQMRLYLDGVLDASVTAAGPAAGNSPLRIGRNSTTGTSYFFNGLIDEVRVSTGALYTGNFTPQVSFGSVAGTRGLWKFNNQSASDSSGNGNNGTLQAGAAYSSDVP